MSTLIKDMARKLADCDSGWKNLTWDTISSNDEILEALYENGYDDGHCNDLDDDEKMEYIRQSDAVRELEGDFSPIMNYVYELKKEPTEGDILKIHEHASNMIIIEDGMGKFFIGMSGAGMDFSEEIAYAYMIIDRCVPAEIEIDKDNNYSLSKEAHKELVGFMC